MSIKLLDKEVVNIIESHLALALGQAGRLTAQDLVKRITATRVEPDNETELNSLTDALLGWKDIQNSMYAEVYFSKLHAALPEELQQRFEDFQQYWQNANTPPQTPGAGPNKNFTIAKHLAMQCSAEEVKTVLDFIDTVIQKFTPLVAKKNQGDEWASIPLAARVLKLEGFARSLLTCLYLTNKKPDLSLDDAQKTEFFNAYFATVLNQEGDDNSNAVAKLSAQLKKADSNEFERLISRLLGHNLEGFDLDKSAMFRKVLTKIPYTKFHSNLSDLHSKVDLSQAGPGADTRKLAPIIALHLCANATKAQIEDILAFIAKAVKHVETKHARNDKYDKLGTQKTLDNLDSLAKSIETHIAANPEI